MRESCPVRHASCTYKGKSSIRRLARREKAIRKDFPRIVLRERRVPMEDAVPALRALLKNNQAEGVH